LINKSSTLFLVAAITGIIFLSLILLLPINTTSLSSNSEISPLLPNQKVIILGKVIKQSSANIKLDNNISLYCPNCPPLINKSIKVESIVSSYYSNKSLSVSKILI